MMMHVLELLSGNFCWVSEWPQQLSPTEYPPDVIGLELPAVLVGAGGNCSPTTCEEQGYMFCSGKLDDHLSFLSDLYWYWWPRSWGFYLFVFFTKCTGHPIAIVLWVLYKRWWGKLKQHTETFITYCTLMSIRKSCLTKLHKKERSHKVWGHMRIHHWEV